MYQEYPVSLVKLSFFFIKVKIIQVLDFDNWHPLNMTITRNLSIRVMMSDLKSCTLRVPLFFGFKSDM